MRGSAIASMEEFESWWGELLKSQKLGHTEVRFRRADGGALITGTLSSAVSLGRPGGAWISSPRKIGLEKDYCSQEIADSRIPGSHPEKQARQALERHQ